MIDSEVSLLFQLADKTILMTLDRQPINTTVWYTPGGMKTVETENVEVVNVQYQEQRGN